MCGVSRPFPRTVSRKAHQGNPGGKHMLRLVHCIATPTEGKGGARRMRVPAAVSCNFYQLLWWEFRRNHQCTFCSSQVSVRMQWSNGNSRKAGHVNIWPMCVILGLQNYKCISASSEHTVFCFHWNSSRLYSRNAQVTKGSDSSQIAEIPAQTELYHASLPPTAGDVNHWSKGHGDRCAWISSRMIKENSDCQWPFCSSPSFLFRIKVGVRSIDLGTRVLQSRHVSSNLQRARPSLFTLLELLFPLSPPH